MNASAKQLLDLRLNFWFSLNTQQQKKLDSLGYSHLFCEMISGNDLSKVTKSKKIMNMLYDLKRKTFRLVA